MDKIKAQGTIEYLIIIAIVVVIALVVVSILTGFLSTGTEINSTSKQIQTLAGEFSLTDLAVTTDGNYVLNIKNNSSRVTITDIAIVDKNNQAFSYPLSQGQQQNFIIYYSTQICVEGTSITNNIKISYTTKHGLVKYKYLENIPFECVNYSTTNSANDSTSTPSSQTTQLNYAWYFINDSNYTFDPDSNTELSSESLILTSTMSNNYYSHSITNADLNADFNSSSFAHFSTNGYTPTGELDWNNEAVNETTSGGWGELYTDFNIQVDNLVGLWHLNETSGNAIDSSGNGNDGTVTGATQGSTGLWGTTSYNFNGSTDFISTGYGSGATPYYGYTVSFWVKPTNYITNNYYAIGAGTGNPNRFYVGNYSNGKWDFGIAQHGISAGTGQVTASNEWTFLTVIVDGANATLYVNGQSTVTWSDIASSFTLGEDFRIGGKVGTSLYNGQIEEVAIWDTALTSEEIKQLYEEQKGQWLDQNLMAYYKFNEASGTTVFDSARGHDGTLTNGDFSKLGMWDTNSLVLNGSNTQVDLGASVLPSDKNFTISAWVKPDRANGWLQGWISAAKTSGDTWCVTIHDTGTTIINSSGSSITLTGSTTIGAWNHQVLTRTENTYKFYINGTLLDTDTLTGDLRCNVGGYSGKTVFGGTFNSGSYQGYYDGQIDEVKVYDRPLSVDEILADYNSFLEAKFVDSNIINTGSEQDWNQIKINSNLYYDFGTQLEDHVSGVARTSELDLSNSLFDSNLVGLWHLNESSGQAQDSSGNANHATITSVTQGADGLWGTDSYELNGSSNYVSIPTNSSINIVDNPKMTLSAWIYPHSDGEGDSGRIFNKVHYASGGGYFFLVNGESNGTVEIYGRVYHSSTNAQTDGTTKLALNQWHHVVMVFDEFDDSKIQLYVDGVLDGGSQQAGVGSLSDDSSRALCIGEDPIELNRAFDGGIEEVAVWSKALSSTEVAELYNSQAGQFHEPSIVGLWHLNGDATDSSGNGNDGTNDGVDLTATGLWNTNAGTFDGGTDVITVSDSANTSALSNFTISGWVYPDFSDNPNWVSKGIVDHMEWRFQLGNGNRLWGRTNQAGGGYLVPENSILQNKWSFLTVTYDGTNLTGWVNGIEYFSVTEDAPADESNGIRIGYASGIGTAFEGKMEEIAIWNRQLSQSEVRDLYRKGISSLDLNVYSCSDASCETKTSSQYITDANNNSWMDTSSLSYSQYLGYEAYFKSNTTDFSDRNAGFFHIGSFLKDVNIENSSSSYASTGYADMNFAVDTTSIFVSITDNNTLNNGSIDYNIMPDSNGDWFTNPDYNISFDYNLTLRTILNNGTSSPTLADVTVNYEQTS